MLEKKCILFLYAEGMYDTSVLATKEYLEKNIPDCYAIAVSDKELFSFQRAKFRQWNYVTSIRNISISRAVNYSLSRLFVRFDINRTKNELKEYKLPTEPFGKWVYSLTEKYRRVYNVIRRFSPDVIVCSTPKLLDIACKAVHNAKLTNTTVSALITDYALDERFVNFRANKYFVQNNEIFEKLQGYGIDEDKIEVVGTPIIEGRLKSYASDELANEFGEIKDRLNIVLVGGRYGNSKIKNAFTSLIEIANDINILVVTGGSLGLSKYCTYLTKSKEKEKNVFLVEYIDDLAKLYSIANTIISSPTAIIPYEAMCHNLNVILCKGCDRLEKQNYNYLTTNGYCMGGASTDEIMTSLNKILNDGDYQKDKLINQSKIVDIDCTEKFSRRLLEIASQNYQYKQEIQSKRLLIQTHHKEIKTLKRIESKEPEIYGGDLND